MRMSKPKWKDGDYWYRRRVPKDIVATYGKREQWQALLTRDPAEAKRRLPDAMKTVETLFDAHRASLGGHQVPRPVSAAHGKGVVAAAHHGEAFYSTDAAIRYYLGARDFAEIRFRPNITSAARANPETFWQGDVIPLAPNVKQNIGITAALAACYRQLMMHRPSEWQDALEIMDLEHTPSFVATIF